MTRDGAPRRRGRPAGLQGGELLAVARRAFLDLGLAGTTMNEVARRAGISKASLYREYASKDSLFAAIVLDWTARGRDAMRPALDALLTADDIVDGLTTLTHTIQAGVLDEDVLRMRRLVAAESDRFPDVAAEYLAGSWDSNIAALAETLAELDRRETLVVDDPQAAAEQLTWLAVGGPLNRQTLGAGRVASEHLTRTGIDAVTTFLHRYGAVAA